MFKAAAVGFCSLTRTVADAWYRCCWVRDAAKASSGTTVTARRTIHFWRLSTPSQSRRTDSSSECSLNPSASAELGQRSHDGYLGPIHGLRGADRARREAQSPHSLVDPYHCL